MDGRALISLISSVILGLLFLYAVVGAAKIYTADRKRRLAEGAPPRRALAWCPGLAGRFAVGTAVLLTILALAVTAASWSRGARPLWALLHQLEGIGPARSKGLPLPAAAALAGATAAPENRPAEPGRSTSPVRRPAPIFVWNGRVMDATKLVNRAEAAPGPRLERRVEERMSPAPRSEKPEHVERVASAERLDRVASVERPEGPRSERMTRAELTERRVRIDRPERVVRVERAERPPRAERPQKPERAGRVDRPERVTRHGR